ncbi:hypothetical protein H8959_022094 [Pygathrix nigripes]
MSPTAVKSNRSLCLGHHRCWERVLGLLTRLGGASPLMHQPPPASCSSCECARVGVRGEEGSFLHFGAAANEGNLLGISSDPLVSASGAGGRDHTPRGTAHLGTRRQLRQAQHPRWELELE